MHNSSSLEIYYQCGLQSTESNALLELTCQIIGDQCFNVLRTQEQLGQHSGCFCTVSVAYIFCCQSEVALCLRQVCQPAFPLLLCASVCAVKKQQSFIVTLCRLSALPVDGGLSGQESFYSFFLRSVCGLSGGVI